MPNLTKLILQSIKLDWHLFKIHYPSISIFKKIQFVFLKYAYIVEFILGINKNLKGYSPLINAKINLESVYGLAGQQRLFVSHLAVIISLTKNVNLNLVVDVGANYGHFSILCAKYLKCSKILSVEADPDTFSKLSENINLYCESNALIPNFELINAIVSDAVGRELIFYSNPEESYLGKVINFNEYINFDINYKKLESINLNELLKNCDLIDLLKIDVEGHEFEVLLGANLALRKTKYLFVECTKVANCTFSSLISLLTNDIYDFELLHFRSLTGSGEGLYEAFDLFFINKNLT